MRRAHGSRRDLPRLPANGSAALVIVVLCTALTCFSLGVVFTSHSSGPRAPSVDRPVRESLLSQQAGTDAQYNEETFWKRAAESDGTPANSSSSEAADAVAEHERLHHGEQGPASAPDAWDVGDDWQSSVELDGGVPESGREALLAYIGIFSAADAQGTDAGLRRRAVRLTWKGSVDRLPSMKAQFVIGRPAKANSLAHFRREPHLKTDFLFLDVLECAAPSCRGRKLLSFYATVAKLYRTEWVVKVDDSVYLNPQRLSLAFPQWLAMGAEYIGCMKKGLIIPERYNERQRFEKEYMLMGSENLLNAHSAVVVLSAAAVEEGIAPNAHHLRPLSSEDASLGLWMASLQVNFFDDMRLCNPICHANAIASFNLACDGLCDPLHDMPQRHAVNACRADATAPLPYMPSLPFNHLFEQMRV